MQGKLCLVPLVEPMDSMDILFYNDNNDDNNDDINDDS